MRFPAHTDTGMYFQYTEADIYPSDSDGEGWNQRMDAMEMDWQYEVEQDDMFD